MQYKLIPQTENTNKRGKSLKTFPDSFVVLDIETTGLNPSVNEIIELSALKIINNRVVKKFSTLVKPEGKISSYITQLTGISMSMTDNAPDIKTAIKNFYDFCSDSIVVGHNVKFDIGFFKLNTEGMHRGLKDCAVTYLCFQKMKQISKMHHNPFLNNSNS